MIKAKEAKIVYYRCLNKMLEIKIKIKLKSPTFKYEPPTVAKITENVIIVIDFF